MAAIDIVVFLVVAGAVVVGGRFVVEADKVVAEWLGGALLAFYALIRVVSVVLERRASRSVGPWLEGMGFRAIERVEDARTQSYRGTLDGVEILVQWNADGDAVVTVSASELARAGVSICSVFGRSDSGCEVSGGSTSGRADAVVLRGPPGVWARRLAVGEWDRLDAIARYWEIDTTEEGDVELRTRVGGALNDQDHGRRVLAVMVGLVLAFGEGRAAGGESFLAAQRDAATTGCQRKAYESVLGS